MADSSYENCSSASSVDLMTLMRVRQLFPPDSLGGMSEIFQLREAVTALAVLAIPESSDTDRQTALSKLREMLALNVQISVIQAEGEAYKQAQGLI